MTITRLSKFVLLFALTIGCAGCFLHGPKVLVDVSQGYNLALQDTVDKQMLLNMVRLKYQDTPYFLEVTSVSTQYSIDAGALASGSLTDNIAKNLGLTANLSYSEKPTITFVPLYGQRFVSRLLSPLSIDVLMLLYNAGWSAERLFRVCVQRINGLENAASASGPTPSYVPAFEDFVQMTKLLRKLQLEGRVHLIFDIHDNGSKATPMLIIEDDAVNNPDVNELYRMLKLKPGSTKCPLTTDLQHSRSDVLRIEMRSLNGILYYLSSGVQVPTSHIARGKVTITRYEDGRVFDWNDLMEDLLNVYVSRLKPRNSFVTIFYRGHYFYIDDSDLNSKSTYGLLIQLVALQSGDQKRAVPLLTLPIGG